MRTWCSSSIHKKQAVRATARGPVGRGAVLSTAREPVGRVEQNAVIAEPAERQAEALDVGRISIRPPLSSEYKFRATVLSDRLGLLPF